MSNHIKKGNKVAIFIYKVLSVLKIQIPLKWLFYVLPFVFTALRE